MFGLFKNKDEEIKQLEEIVKAQDAELKRIKAERDFCVPFINSLAKPAEPNNPYKYQVYNPDAKVKTKIYIVLRKDEKVIREEKCHSFTLELFDIKKECFVSFAQVKVFYDPMHCNKNTLKIIELQTKNGYRKKGFASFLLKHIIQYAEMNLIARVWGEVRHYDTDADFDLLAFTGIMGLKLPTKKHVFSKFLM